MALRGLVMIKRKDISGCYDVDTDINIDNVCNYLCRYYNEKNLSIIGFNDLSGISFMNSFSHSLLLKKLSSYLKNFSSIYYVVDAFQSFVNKPEHIDYFLDNNISLEEIKFIQSSGVVGLLNKKISNISLPMELASIGELCQLYYRPSEKDKNIYFMDLIRDSYEPIIIYSSGFSDLMRMIGSNSTKIEADYLNKNRQAYHYTYDKIFDTCTLQYVMDKIRRNIEHILTINHNADIIVMGSDMVHSKIDIFNDFILKYNEELRKLCSEYHLFYLDTIDIGNKKESVRVKVEELCMSILQQLYFMKRGVHHYVEVECTNQFYDAHGGIRGVVDEMGYDFDEVMKYVSSFYGYDRERELDKASECLQYKRVMEKVLRRTSRNT